MPDYAYRKILLEADCPRLQGKIVRGGERLRAHFAGDPSLFLKLDRVAKEPYLYSCEPNFTAGTK